MVHLKKEVAKKTASNEEEKSALSPREYIVPQVVVARTRPPPFSPDLAPVTTYSQNSEREKDLLEY